MPQGMGCFAKPTDNLASYPGRNNRNNIGMANRRLGMPHPGKNMGEVNMFQLGCPVACQLGIQVLAGTSKRLQPIRRLSKETLLNSSR